MGKYVRNQITICVFTLLCSALLSAGPAAADLEEHITRTETGFYYTIQKGDTLWDLSQKFADSPWDWPELWHYNPQIPNPHLIYPGNKILIFKKEWEEKGKERAEKPVETVETYTTYIPIDEVGFIREQAVTPSGTIFKALNDISQITVRDQVYIRPTPGVSLAVGDKFTVYRTISPILDAQTKKYIGVQHLLLGVAEITKTEPEFAVGKIIESYREIAVHDLLMPYSPQSPKIALKESIDGLDAKIIKNEEDILLLGQNAIAFINKGKNDGVEPGQSYGIFKQETARPDPKRFKTLTLTPEDVGRLLVLRTEPTTATVLITQSKEPLEPGQFVRPACEP